MSDLDQLQQQQADTVEVFRSILEGKWDQGRIQLDAIDPNRAGKWENVAFPRHIAGPASTPVLHQWQSNNYWPGRPFGGPIAFVLHTEAGSEGGTEAEFTNNATQVSAHFGVSLAGSIDQFVSVWDSAWGNGILEPGNAWQANGLPNRNPNYLTVSCETEDLGNGGQDVTDAQYNAVLQVARYVQRTCPTIYLLLSHRDISPSSRAHCCGDRWWGSGRFDQLAKDTGLKTL